jgi:hypothetical protein
MSNESNIVEPNGKGSLDIRLARTWGRITRIPVIARDLADAPHDGRLDRQLARYPNLPHLLTGGVVLVYLMIHLASLAQGLQMASWYYHLVFWAAIMVYVSWQVGSYLVEEHGEEDLQLMTRRPLADRPVRQVRDAQPTPTTREQGEDETTEQWMERMQRQHEENKRKKDR